MADPFIGEIRINAFSFAPAWWAPCEGQSMSVSQNQALYALLGNRYGGDSTTFYLPDLRGRVPIHTSPAYPQGNAGGASSVALDATTVPNHTHGMVVSAQSSTANTPGNNALAAAGLYADANNLVAMNPVGGAATAHNNLQPYLNLSFCIALAGIYPTES